jgi:hypothetical protein
MQFLTEKQAPGLEIREGQYHFISKPPLTARRYAGRITAKFFTSLTNPTKPTHMTPVRDFFTREIGQDIAYPVELIIAGQFCLSAILRREGSLPDG